VTGPGGGRIPGITVQIYIPGSAKIPGDDVVTTTRSDDRNYERTMFNPGAFEVVLSDGSREISPRISVTLNDISQCSPQEGGAGSQWVQVNFRAN
jgi:hypothetical protein